MGKHTRYTPQVRVEGVDRVVARVVEAEHYVALDALGVVDEQIGDGGAVRDELGANALGRDGVLAIGIGALGAVRRRLRGAVLREGRGRKEREHGRGPHGAGSVQLTWRDSDDPIDAS